MATIKLYADIAQSRKLAEILPLESADMYYYYGMDIHTKKWEYDTTPTVIDTSNQIDIGDIPCWSLAALLSVLPNNNHITTTLSRGGWKIEPVEYIDKWFCEYEDEVDEDSPCRGFTVSADNPVDACYEIIIKLNELKRL